LVFWAARAAVAKFSAVGCGEILPHIRFAISLICVTPSI
jgi:hypothetical protein